MILELDWLLSGTFFIRASITESSGTEFACLQFVMEMTQEEEQETTTEREEGDFCDQCLSEYDEVIKGRFLDVEDELMDEQRSFVFSECHLVIPDLTKLSQTRLVLRAQSPVVASSLLVWRLRTTGRV